MYDVCNCFTVKVFVSNFKVEKVKTWTTLSAFFTFFDITLQKKRKKSRFLDFQKNLKNIFSNYGRRHTVSIQTDESFLGVVR